MTNQQVADFLGMSRVLYEKKKQTGKFIVTEVSKLCQLFDCNYEYLFAIDNDVA